MSNSKNSISNLAKLSAKKLMATTAMTAAGLMMFSGAAKAIDDNTTPTGGNAVIGGITIDQVGTHTDINQSEDVGLIHWDSFNHGKNATTEFHQPDAQAWTFNRVVGNTDGARTIIEGSITANGNIGILDDNGVLITDTGSLDAAGVLLSTGNIENLDTSVSTGKFEITDLENGSITNRGTITVAEAGLAAFVSPTIANNGVINARLGNVVMAAGKTVTLDLMGDGLVEIAVDGELANGLITNSGRINAFAGNVQISAAIAKEAVDNVINMSGVVNTSSAVQKGGKIIISGGDNGRVLVNTALNANGKDAQNGGEISVTGENVFVSNNGRLRANSETGAAGEIKTIASNNLRINGQLSAQGDDDTGFIETSAPETNFGANASILATREWLLDPTDIVVNTGSTLEGLIEGQLGTGDMTLQTPVGGTDEGNIDINTVIDWATNNTFKVIADNDVNLNTAGGINATGAGSFVAMAGDDVEIDGDITTQGGNVSLIAGVVPSQSDVNVDGDINTNGGNFDAIAGDDVRIRSDFFTSGGDVTLTTLDNVGASEVSVTAAADIQTGGGDVTINSDGIRITESAGTFINAGTGSVILNRVSDGTISLGGVAGDTEITSAALDSITAMELVVGNNFATGIDVNAIDTTANIANKVTLNALGAAGKINFQGANDFSALDANANPTDGEINVLDGSVTAIGEIDFDAPTINLNGDLVASAITGNAQVVNVQSDAAQIQDGVDVAAQNAMVNVAAGTYGESVTVNKLGLQLLGANAGLNGADLARGPESLVTPTGAPGFLITSDDVVLDGFAVDGGTDGVSVSNALRVSVKNNAIINMADNGIKYVSSDDGFIQGNKVSAAGHNGIAVIDSNNATVNMLNVIDGTSSAGVAFNRTTNSLVDGNEISNTGGSGVWINQADGATVSNNDIDTTWLNTSRSTGSGVHVKDTDGANILSNDIANAGIDGVNVEGSNSINIDDNDIDVATNGIRVSGGSDMTVTNNEIDDASEAAIHVSNADNAQIVANEINDNGASTFVNYGILVDGGKSVDVDNNKIEETNITAIAANNTSFIDIDDNLVKDGNGDGIRVENGRNADIRRNETRDMADDGIQVISHNNVDIERNIVLRSDDSGITVSGSNNANIDDNNVDVARNGIRVSGRKDANISNNEVDDASDAAILVLNNDDAQIISNKINDNGATTFTDHGILIEGGNSVDVDDNKIEETNIAGILANNTTFINIDDNLVKDGNGDGIKVADGRNADIRRNTVQDMRFDGIEADDHNNLDVENNIINRVGDNGIEVDDSNNANITGNEIVEADDDGIDVDGGEDANIFQNLIALSGDDGIDVNDNDNAQILENGILGSGFGSSDGNGIELSNSADADILENIVLLTADDGIEVDDSENVNIRRNIVALAGDDGVDVDDSRSADVVNNQIGSVLGNGVQVSDSNRARVNRNQITGTGENGVEVDDSNSIRIRNNDISQIGDDGIDVDDSNRVRITDNVVNDVEDEGIQVTDATGGGTSVILNGNDVQNTESGSGISLNRFDDAIIEDNRVRDTGTTTAIEGNGIIAENGNSIEVTDNVLRRNGGNGIETDSVDEVSVSENLVRRSGENGIAVSEFDVADIDDNDIARTGDDGIEATDGTALTITQNEINRAGADGVHVEDIAGLNSDRFNVRIVNNEITNSADDGVEALNANRILAARNTVDQSGDDGINIVKDGLATTSDPRISLAVVRNNVVSNSIGDGAEVGGFERSRIRTNEVSGSLENGLNISGGDNGEVEVSGNTLTDNDTGIQFQSGEIDLTGDTNEIIGGTTGMRFSTFLDPATGAPANMELVGNTLGAQNFQGQTGDYLTLENGALFNPGTPTILDPTDSTFDAIGPEEFYTAAQLTLLDSKITDFNDNGNTGLFLFPALADISQEDVFQFFANGGGDLGGLNLTILGLPGVPGGPQVASLLNNINPAAGGNSAAALNNINPAAGGDGGGMTPEELNALETAAGDEESNSASCWGDTLNAAAAGGAVNFSYGSGAKGLLNSEASCGS